MDNRRIQNIIDRHIIWALFSAIFISYMSVRVTIHAIPSFWPKLEALSCIVNMLWALDKIVVELLRQLTARSQEEGRWTLFWKFAIELARILHNLTRLFWAFVGLLSLVQNTLAIFD